MERLGGDREEGGKWRWGGEIERGKVRGRGVRGK